MYIGEGECIPPWAVTALSSMALSALLVLPAALLHPSCHAAPSLSVDLRTAQSQFGSIPNNFQLIAPLLEAIVCGARDETIWEAVNTLVARVLVQTPSQEDTEFAKGSILNALQKGWTSTYLSDSLDILQDLVRDKEALSEDYYAKTMVFVQSSGMGKSRLADTFGQSCPMINFVLREEGTSGFPPADPEILSFIRSTLSQIDHTSLRDSPMKGVEETTKNIRAARAEAVWNHSIAVGLLQASFEICRLPMLLAIHKVMG
jgi:hypothetical protein